MSAKDASGPLLGIGVGLALAVLPLPAEAGGQEAGDGRLDVAFLVWDGMELVESMGPAHVFAFAPGMDGFTVSETRAPIRSEFVTIVPEYALEDCPEPDVIVVPGGSIWVPMGDPAYGEWLRRHVPRTELTLTVCNAAVLLADLGLLDGHEATCGAGNLDDLMLLGENVRAYVNRRWVHSGNLVTSQSYLAGIDAAIHAVGVLRGPEGEEQVLSWSNHGCDPSRFDALHAEPGRIPLSRRRAIVAILRTDGVEAAVERYRAWVASGEPAYSPPLDGFDEAGMFQWMAWGHQRLGRHELSLAICEFKARVWPDSAKERAYLGEALTKAGRLDEALETLLEALALDAADRSTLVFLGRLLHHRDLAPSEATRRARGILRERASSSTGTLVPEDEPGTPLTVAGVVRDEADAPVPNALVHVFQADADGLYTRRRAMDEPNARLFAYLRTDADGSFRFDTVRPGHYPGAPDRTGVDWEIPAHVHFEVEAPGFRPRRFQMVLEDDPRMQPARWQEWAAAGSHPVVAVSEAPDGSLRCRCDVDLTRE